MSFRFEDLNVWHRAVDLSNEINTLVKSFPEDERYSLCKQMMRSADSVVLNIAEGSTGQSIPEYKRFLNIALRSAIEIVAALFLARKRVYIKEVIFKKYYEEYEVLCKMITKLRNTL
ncbi:30S ribosomal protein S23 [Niabella soli DSM 19437]|uniref:30S ribosomal protein S23 n=2 Tax=Niabella TaxID=379899 RepID=W0F262_9BACT|nr:30S ribosomal protein S23 [Niabella soli DSM 19437]